MIFKEKNLSKNWLSKQVSKEWHVSANLIEWISNIHDQEWLEKCFESMIWEKANEQMWLLICDDHDNHISEKFIHHYIQHDIILILLSSYYFHLF